MHTVHTPQDVPLWPLRFLKAKSTHVMAVEIQGLYKLNASSSSPLLLPNSSPIPLQSLHTLSSMSSITSASSQRGLSSPISHGTPIYDHYSGKIVLYFDQRIDRWAISYNDLQSAYNLAIARVN